MFTVLAGKLKNLGLKVKTENLTGDIIPGHISHWMVEPGTIESRLYQQTIYATAVKHNTLVILPTALGKTVISLLVAVNRLEKYDWSKVVVLAPTIPLITQHKQNFERFLIFDKDKIALITGKVRPADRQAIWKQSQLIFETPQTLRNDLRLGRCDLKDVSLLIFDEAHRARKRYAYTYIARKYIEQCRDPLILGLTASPGGSPEQIEEICNNLFIESVEYRTDNDEDVRPYIHRIDLNWHEVDLPESYREIEKLVKSVMYDLIREIRKMGLLLEKKVEYISKKDLLKLGWEMRKKIAEGEKRHYFWVISLQSAAITLMHAVELLTTQDIQSFHRFIHEKMETKDTKAMKRILGDYRFKRAVNLTEQALNCTHPKFDRLKRLVREELGKNPDSRMIVFSQYRDTISKILEHFKALDGVRAVRFVGQADRTADKGLKQKEQVRVIQNFNDGIYNVLVSSSVGEEGIDLPSVQKVIFYEPVPSEVRLIQRRGRTGRKEAGSVDILITRKTLDQAFYWASRNRESKMRRIVSSLNVKLSQKVEREPLEKKEIAEEAEPVVEPETAISPVITEYSTSGITKGLSKAVKWVLDYLNDNDNGDGVAIERLIEDARGYGINRNAVLSAVSYLLTESEVYQPDVNRVSVV